MIGDEGEDGGPRPRKGSPRDGAGIQSLQRGVAILEEIARSEEGISLADLTRRVQLHNSTTYSLTQTLVALGCIAQNKVTRRYHIGPKLFALAASALGEVHLVEFATPILNDLSSQTGETAHFAIMSGNDVVVAARSAGPGALQVAFRQGGIWPAHCTALGKVLLAHLPQEKFEAFLASQPLIAVTPNSIVEPTRLRDEIERTRKTDFGYDDGEFDKDVRCVAVPVFDFAGRVAGAIGISGPMLRLTLPRLDEAAQTVKRAADRLSAALGARAPGAAGDAAMPEPDASASSAKSDGAAARAQARSVARDTRQGRLAAAIVRSRPDGA